MKTEDEIKLDNALDEYFDKFGENYPLVITSMMTNDEIIADINKYIKSGKPKPEPKLNKRYDY
ncbi:MAG: hypothetical protein II000_07370 [Clostridia bacterium]|nr:hypothetical protein [Clostridia bacterium]